jgi:hypothetical protein
MIVQKTQAVSLRWVLRQRDPIVCGGYRLQVGRMHRLDLGHIDVRCIRLSQDPERFDGSACWDDPTQRKAAFGRFFFVRSDWSKHRFKAVFLRREICGEVRGR